MLSQNNQKDLIEVYRRFGVSFKTTNKKQLSSIKIDKIFDDKRIIRILKDNNINNLFKIMNLTSDEINKLSNLGKDKKTHITSCVSYLNTLVSIDPIKEAIKKKEPMFKYEVKKTASKVKEKTIAKMEDIYNEDEDW